MKIGYLGAGTWGFCLASLLADNGHDVILWDANCDRIALLNETREHPKLPGYTAPASVVFTSVLSEALSDVDMLVEGVTSAGIRPVFERVNAIGVPDCPIVLTSKGIEQDSGLLLIDVVASVIGEQYRANIAYLSGPSHAEEVIKKFPTSVVCASCDGDTMVAVRNAFSGPRFRVYLNGDIRGVAFGGAMKNIIAIACGVSDGLGFGDNSKAALMTRGLYEIRKLSVVIGCNPQTLIGLSGVGDLCVTCLSRYSRNYLFGIFLAEGFSPSEAREKIGMAVEGAYTCKSAYQLSTKFSIDAPITEVVYRMIYEGMAPRDAVESLIQRPQKEELL